MKEERLKKEKEEAERLKKKREEEQRMKYDKIYRE